MKIIGASVVFVCDREFSIIRDGGVAYDGERIVEVGVYKELVAKYTKSPTAIPRILEEEKGAECEKSASLSLRDTAKDSALGNHCTDFTNFLKKHRLAASGIPCFERTADHQSSSLSKFVKNSTSNTAIPRILEKHKQAGCEKSCREQTELESSFQQNAQKSKKVDFRGNAPSLSLRALAQDKARQSNSAPAESNQINGACEARNLESVVGGLGAKGVKRGG